MWIRTQDKGQLINCKNNFYLNSFYIGPDSFYIDPESYTNIYADDEVLLGRYDTFERALEVLDDIETSIQSLIHIYHMPEA